MAEKPLEVMDPRVARAPDILDYRLLRREEAEEKADVRHRVCDAPHAAEESRKALPDRAFRFTQAAP